MFKLPPAKNYVRLVGLSGICMIVLCAVVAGCKNKPEIIDSKNVQSILIASLETHFSPKVIVNADSVRYVLKKLNNAEKELGKMYVRYRVDIYYKNGSKVSAYCNESAMKIDSQVYKFYEKIGDVLE